MEQTYLQVKGPCNAGKMKNLSSVRLTSEQSLIKDKTENIESNRLFSLILFL